MTDLTFKINGADFSRHVHKYGYQTDRQPVYAAQFTDLSGVDHNIPLRWKGVLTVTLNPMTEAQSARMCAALAAYPLEVTYHSFQLGKDVTEAMTVSTMSRSLALKRGAVRWHEGGTITFTGR